MYGCCGILRDGEIYNTILKPTTFDIKNSVTVTSEFELNYDNDYVKTA